LYHISHPLRAHSTYLRSFQSCTILGASSEISPEGTSVKSLP